MLMNHKVNIIGQKQTKVRSGRNQKKTNNSLAVCGLIDYCRVSNFILITKVCHYNESCTSRRLKLGNYTSLNIFSYSDFPLVSL